LTRDSNNPDAFSLLDYIRSAKARPSFERQGLPTQAGARLRVMCDQGELTLYPATYRIVFNDKNA